MIPSLVVNICEECNFDCIYCPPFGENINKGITDYDFSSICTLIDIMYNSGCNLIRFTGGEPLLYPERLKFFLDYVGDKFDRTVINTNGYFLLQNLDWLYEYKDNIVLKVSLDSLTYEEEKKITRVSREYSNIVNALKQAKKLGFNIEINTVLCIQSLDSIIELLSFCNENEFDLKLLTVSSFYNNVELAENTILYNSVLDYLNNNSVKLNSERLKTGLGAKMLAFNYGKVKVLMIDHRKDNSFTPMKMFSKYCLNNCNIFPCDCGMMSITVSTDGYVSPCRGRKDLGFFMFNMKSEIIKSKISNMLEIFSDLEIINVNGGCLNDK